MKKIMVMAYKENFPFKDESFKRVFDTIEKAKEEAFKLAKEGYDTMIQTVVWSEDDERWICL